MRNRRSIITDDLTTDFFDGSRATEVHHVCGGANRKKSEEDGLIVGLNHWNHNEPPNGVHFDSERNRMLKQIGEVSWIREVMKSEQIDFETAVDLFRSRYGRNYL